MRRVKPRVKITAPQHPHHGEIGRLDFDDTIAHTGQIKLELENCRHGTEGCYVSKDEVKMVRE